MHGRNEDLTFLPRRDLLQARRWLKETRRAGVRKLVLGQTDPASSVVLSSEKGTIEETPKRAFHVL